jgi:hypothetical protein
MGYGSNPFIEEYGPNRDVRMTFQFGMPDLMVSYLECCSGHFAESCGAKWYGLFELEWSYWSSQWEVYAGARNGSQLECVRSVANAGFETSFSLKELAAYVQVAAHTGEKLLQKSAVVSAASCTNRRLYACLV